MKTNTFAIVVGTSACNARCPFCIAKMTKTMSCRKCDINEKKFDTACRIVDQMRDGLVTVILTGQGEPLLWPDQISQYLGLMGDRFPLIEMQTNGILVKKNLDNFRKWYDQGLSLVCLSITHTHPKVSNDIMGIKVDYDHWEAARLLQEIGLSVRINCTMAKGGVDGLEEVEWLISEVKERGIEKLTLREVEKPMVGANQEIASWVDSVHYPISKSLLPPLTRCVSVYLLPAL